MCVLSHPERRGCVGLLWVLPVYFLKGSIHVIERVVFFPTPDPAKCLKFKAHVTSVISQLHNTHTPYILTYIQHVYTIQETTQLMMCKAGAFPLALMQMSKYTADSGIQPAGEFCLSITVD